MNLDNSFLVTLVLNVGFLLLFFRFGFNLLNENYLNYTINPNFNSALVTKIVNEAAVIIPRFKIGLRVRRMIKSNADQDETPFYLSQLI